MSQEITRDLNGDRPFEERVFARFDGIEDFLRSLDTRLQALESRRYDTKPIWERALKEILETRVELKDTRYDLNTFKRDVADRLDQIQKVVLETRIGLRQAHERIDDLESKPV